MALLSKRWSRFAALAVSAGLIVSACSSSATTAPAASSAPGASSAPAASQAPAGPSGTITVAMVGNPQMKALEKVMSDPNNGFNKLYPNVKVNLLVLPENELRAKVTTDITTAAGQFDLMTIGMFEVPQWAKQGWLEDVGTTLDANSAYNSADIFKSIRDGLSYNGKLYAAPFYGESSAIFYRKDLFQAAGITMPDKPTWDEVAAAAKALHNPSKQQFGICLRGLPGWGEMGAPLGTVINTFGGRWFDASWKAQVTSPETSAAIKFYIDLVKKYGEPGATQAGFTECETLLTTGKVAMWYDATSASDLIFDPKQDPDYADKIGIAYAPTKVKSPSGWLWAWAFGMASTSKNKPAAFAFLEWATSMDYVQIVAKDFGWGSVPSGSRKSLYADPGYKEYAKAFSDVVVNSLGTVDPLHATNFADTPYTGIQFVQIPEFQDLGTQATGFFAAALAGSDSIDGAITKANDLANQIAKDGQYQK